MMEDYNMNFIDKAFENKLHGDDFLQALDNCGANEEADVLRQAKAMSTDDYAENYDDLCDKLAINNDYDGFWDLVRDYIDASLND